MSTREGDEEFDKKQQKVSRKRKASKPKSLSHTL